VGLYEAWPDFVDDYQTVKRLIVELVLDDQAFLYEDLTAQLIALRPLAALDSAIEVAADQYSDYIRAGKHLPG